MSPIAAGINSRDRSLANVLQSILDAIERLKRPQSTHIGGIGGVIGANMGYTLSVDPATGNFIATSDAGTQTVIAAP